MTDAETLPRRKVVCPTVNIVSRLMVPQHCVGFLTRQDLTVTS